MSADGRSENWRHLDFWAEAGRLAREFAAQQAAEANVDALFSWSSAASAHFTRALVAWRTGLTDPAPDFEAAVAASEAAIGFMTERDVGPYRINFDAMPGAVSAILLDRAESPAIDAGIRDMDPIGTWKRPKPVKATAWLISALAGQGSGGGPRIASELAATKEIGALGTGARGVLRARPNRAGGVGLRGRLDAHVNWALSRAPETQ